MEENSIHIDTFIAKVILGAVLTVLIGVTGHGLIMWKNQAAIMQELASIKPYLEKTEKLTERVTTIDSVHTSKMEEHDKKLEEIAREVSINREDKYAGGGSFRRNDANLLKDNLLERNAINAERISQNEKNISIIAQKLSSLEQDLLECKRARPNYALQKDLEDLEDELDKHEDFLDTFTKQTLKSTSSLEEKCNKLLKEIK
jgi:hypothetical protein